MVSEFGTAKGILKFLTFAGWALAGLAVVGAAVIYSDAPSSDLESRIFAVASAVSGVIFGLVIVAVGQLGLAQIATAENTATLVQIMRRTPTSGEEGVQDAAGRAKDFIKEFKGRELTRHNGRVVVDGFKSFDSVFEAEKWINSRLSR